LLEATLSTHDWVDYLSALLTPTIAIAAVAIGLLQWRTNRNRLKHELFDRRYEQFEAVRDFLGSIMGSGRALDDKQADFSFKTRGLRFIYDKKLADYIDSNIWGPAVDLASLHSELEGVSVGEERSKNLQKQSKIKKNLNREFQNLDSLFSKYLQLRH
jgi:hypothetical protein